MVSKNEKITKRNKWLWKDKKEWYIYVDKTNYIEKTANPTKNVFKAK